MRKYAGYIVYWECENAAERVALAPIPSELYKIAYEKDTGTFWVLIGLPSTWRELLTVTSGAFTTLAEASESLAAGDFVNVYDDSGTSKVRKASADNPARFANGFVLDAAVATDIAIIYPSGVNNAVVGVTIGDAWLGLNGAFATAPSTTAGHIQQLLGSGITSSQIYFTRQPTIEVA